MTASKHAYVGSRTTRERQARGEGISVYAVDEETGALDRVQLVGGLANPSFLALDAPKRRLYAVHGDGNEVSVFAVSPVDGTLEFMQRQVCGGRNPVHLALDPTGRWLLVSDHLGTDGGGSLLVMPVHDDGRLGPVSQRVAMAGEPGPHRREQPFAKPHFNPFDPSGRYVAVPDKGLDRVFVFRFDGGTLAPAAPPGVGTRAGAGPRHIAFHPSAPFAYVANELDSTVTAYRFHRDSGALAPLQILPTLDDTFTGNNTASEIEISKDGRSLYVSNRGADSIALFDVDAATGRLRFRETTPSRGRTPRFFALGLDGRCMFVLNEDSDTIEVFPVDRSTGRLGQATQSIRCGSPVCLVM
ncbi:lactonase family protein [Xylophilus sp.]|uniref:lactonase family protein n=1 Tax=Xylophilus sp. TaxID=2653893 RepID=UPI0013BC2DCD|nr:lactonase family protein [Xylophilus sp.]KAF1050285.1 MAG: 6-phosphogluconolactonase [Xylophilus sp.]